MTTPPETLVPEETVEFDGHRWGFRRNNDEPGTATWQVFRDDVFTPAGFVRAVYQPSETSSNEGWQLAVFDGNGLPIGELSHRATDGTVPAVDYPRQALDWIRARMTGIA